jgi:hypothetical protein
LSGVGAVVCSVAWLGCNGIFGIEEGELRSDREAGARVDANVGADGDIPNVDASEGDGGPIPATDSGVDGAVPGCSPTCNGPTPICFNGTCVACTPGSNACFGDTPQSCAPNGTWQNGAACGGQTPVCNAGTCGSTRLRGALGTVGPRAPPGAVRIRDEGFEYDARTCSATTCIKGGITTWAK